MATIDGDDGDNALNGTNESDLIRAFGGDDDIFFSSGFDEIHGGAGFDQIRYETLFQGIVVNFTGFGSGTVTKYYGPGSFETDTFFEIEGIVGTQYADGFNNSSDGYARFRGLQGADVYNGSATGFDEVDYLRDANFGGHNGVVIDLAAGTGTDGFGNTEVLSNIDGVRGTQYADLLIGSSGNNDLNGEGGNDVLQGGAGEDLLIGGNGSDLLEGGEGDDQLEGDAGSDTLIGGDGFDALNYRADPLGITAIFTGDLAGTVEQGDGSIDVFQEIEAVLGTDHDDVFINSGSAFTVRFRGRDGTDSYSGFAGGADEIDFRGEDEAGGSGITINLSAGSAIDGYGNLETFTSIERARGTDSADLLIGSDDDNRLRGIGGDDIMAGGLGNDLIEGGEGQDVAVLRGLNGGGHDLLQFGGTVFALDLRDHSFDRIVDVEGFWDPVQAIGIGAVEQFDALAYAASYDDLAQFFRVDGNAAAQHYVTTGFFEGREVAFDASQYLANYADLQAAFGNDLVKATQHFLQSGVDEHRLAEDALDYIASYADLIGAFGGQSAGELQALGLMHYAAAGFDEGRRTGIDFDAEQYLANHGDLQAAFGGDDDAAAVHFINAGYGEHRLADDPLDYIASYADLIEAFGSQTGDQLRQSGIAHYQAAGFGEGRGADFDVDHYLANYDDLRAAFADGSGGYDEMAATLHYIQAGYFEGRTDDPMMA